MGSFARKFRRRQRQAWGPIRIRPRPDLQMPEGITIGFEDEDGLVMRHYTPEQFAQMGFGVDRPLDGDTRLLEQLTPAEQAAWRSRCDAVHAEVPQTRLKRGDPDAEAILADMLDWSEDDE